MTAEEKVAELRSIIVRELTPLITHDYVLWGLPYHTNIGDTLIWEGDLAFLHSLPFRCLGVCPWDAFPTSSARDNAAAHNPKVPIVLHGGGYLGDTWRDGWLYAQNAICQYPDNPVVIFPQTIYYKDEGLLAHDKAELSRLKQLTICARDRVSYEFATTHFGSFARILLVPDMAFCIDPGALRRWCKPVGNRSLYLKRLDKEAPAGGEAVTDAHTDVRDWPTLEPGYRHLTLSLSYRVMKLRAWGVRCGGALGPAVVRWADRWMQGYYRPFLIRVGVRFLSRYRSICTTRLHVLILSVLLGKEGVSEDNSYGKLSSFYDTWLSDVDHVSIDRTHVKA